MNKNAVSKFGVKARFLVSALAAAMLLVGLCSTSYAAAPVSKDGTIHACYKVKGKPKGTLRVVGAKARCKRGERKVVWSAAGSSGAAGANGQGGANGASGGSGQSGSNGTNGTEAVLKSQIASLTVKLEGLEGILGGITHGQLLSVLGTLNGVNNAGLLNAVDAVKGLDNTKLTETVDSLPLVGSICDQTSALTSQSNLLRTSLGGLVTTLTGSVLGAIFGGVTLPAVLTDPLNCPAP